MLPLCAWTLPTGQLCRQPALRGRVLCRAHEKLARIEKLNLQNQHISQRIATLDLFALIECLQDTLQLASRHRISPSRQRMIYTAVHRRLTALFLDHMREIHPQAFQAPAQMPPAQ